MVETNISIGPMYANINSSVQAFESRNCHPGPGSTELTGMRAPPSRRPVRDPGGPVSPFIRGVQKRPGP